MSRKEIIKKSLGITEYSWSSDDEDLAAVQPLPEVHIVRRQMSEPRPSVADAPGTSGQQAPSSPTLSPARRSQGKIERELLYSLMNNPHKVSSGDVSRSRLCEVPGHQRVSMLSWPPVVHTPPLELRERTERPSAAADIQRMIPYKKMMRNFGALRAAKSNSNLYTCLTSRGPLRNPIFSPSGPSDLPHSVRTCRVQSALKRLQASRSAMRLDSTAVDPRPLPRLSAGGPRAAPGPGSWAGPAQAEAAPAPDDAWMDEPVLVDEPSPVNHTTDDVLELPDNSPRPAANEAEPVETETIDVDTTHTSTGGGVSLEEEIVEIDAPDDVDADVNVIGDGDGDDNNVVNSDVRLNEASAAPASDETVALQQQNQENNKRRREENASADDAEPYTVKEFNQSLLRLLECPVCLEWMEPPMSQCRRGHLVCSRCRGRLASCPVCRTTFSSVRNRAMEGVAEMVRYPCRHGCGREVRLRRRAGHEASCGARRYHCPAPVCSDRPPLPRDHLHQHFQGKHMSMLKIGRKHKFSMKVNSEQHDTWLITALHEYFYLRVDVDIRTWGVVVYVAYIGPKCNAKNFTYEVSVVGQHNSRKLVYTRVTHSDLESSTLNVSRQDCFHLTLDQALNFLRFKNRHCEPEKFLDFNVEISKSEPVEGRDDSDS